MKDMLSINTVNDNGFQYMLNKFETPNDRTAFARYFIPVMYECEKAKVSSALLSDVQ